MSLKLSYLCWKNYKICLICRVHSEYHEPLDMASLQHLARKNFAEETMKKISWVVNMYTDWRRIGILLEMSVTFTVTCMMFPQLMNIP